MSEPLDLKAIKKRAESATPYIVDSGYQTLFEPVIEVDVPALVAEVERLRTNNAELVALIQPILDRTEGHIGTHSSRCFEYHVACLAHLVRERLTETGNPSSLNSQEAH